MRRTEIVLAHPSIEEVEFALKVWNEQENYVRQENALVKLFMETYPTNTDINDIIIKAASLNDIYNTNIFNIFAVAKHVQELNIDDRLHLGDATLVEDIADITIGGKKRRLYSFASKYCSHHNPKMYPIYDSFVDLVLRYFRKVDGFCFFADNELKNYPRFIEILNEFQRFYGLQMFNKRDLDRYLWQLGVWSFPRNYK